MNDLISRQDAINALNKKWVEEDFEDEFGYGFDACLNWMDVLIRKLPSAQQWIPCSERLPEKDGRYLCTYLDLLDRTKVFVDSILYEDGRWFVKYVKPVAWMPLPEPWKGVADDN